IRQRPTRTLISTSGVALGVILIILNTALARGMLNDRIRREQGVGAEIQFWRVGAQSLSTSNAMPLDVRVVERRKDIPAVRMFSPAAQFVQSSNSGLRFEMVDAIELDTYSAISKLRIVEGHGFQPDDEVIVGEFRGRRGTMGVGRSSFV